MFMQFLNGRIQRPFKSESGASGPKSVARGTKSITFAYVFFSYAAVWGGTSDVSLQFCRDWRIGVCNI